MREDIKTICRTFFKDDYGKPFEAPDGQAEIIEIVAKRLYPRVHVMTATQFGKSTGVAIGSLLRVSNYPEKWTIIGGTQKKARIIMAQVIQHSFDHEQFYKRLELSKEESLERLRRERSKNRLTFKTDLGGFGEILILSAEAERKRDFEEPLIGFGSPNILEDDAALIPNPIHSTVMRMLGGHKDNFLMKIGNPFRRNHFLKSFQNPNYYKVVIDWEQAVKEGRLTKEFIEEMKKEAFFDILYECKFPSEEMILEGGWMPVMTEDDLNRQLIDEPPYLVGEIRMGVDVASGGRNWSVVVLRADNFAQIIYRSHLKDPVELATKVKELWDKINAVYSRSDRMATVYGMRSERAKVFVDAMGVGAKTYGKLKEIIPNYTFGVLAGDKAIEFEKFFNKKAEMIWRMRETILAGLKLVRHQDWTQLLDLKYKIHMDRRIKTMPKEQMIREGIESPDAVDALALTFSLPPSPVGEAVGPIIAGEGKEDLEIY